MMRMARQWIAFTSLTVLTSLAVAPVTAQALESQGPSVSALACGTVFQPEPAQDIMGVANAASPTASVVYALATDLFQNDAVYRSHIIQHLDQIQLWPFYRAAMASGEFTPAQLRNAAQAFLVSADEDTLRQKGFDLRQDADRIRAMRLSVRALMAPALSLILAQGAQSSGPQK